YQEIPSNEVLITTTYILDSSKAAAKPAEAAAPTPAGLLDIIRSGCIGCHEFKARAMGPSFAAMAARYPDNQASVDTLSRYIREGSMGCGDREPCLRTGSSPRSSCMILHTGS